MAKKPTSKRTTKGTGKSKTKKTQNQILWAKQIARLKGVITRGLKRGLEFAEDVVSDIIPKTPSRITAKKLNELTAIRPKDVYAKATFKDASGQLFTGNEAIEKAFPTTAKEYRRERKRVDSLIRRAKQRGDISIPEFIYVKPSEATEADLQFLKSITPDKFYSFILSKDASGNYIPGAEAKAQRVHRKRTAKSTKGTSPVTAENNPSVIPENEKPVVENVPSPEGHYTEKTDTDLDKSIEELRNKENKTLTDYDELTKANREKWERELKHPEGYETPATEEIPSTKEDIEYQSGSDYIPVKGTKNTEKPYTVNINPERSTIGVQKADSDKWIESETALEGTPEAIPKQFNETGYRAMYDSGNVFELIRPAGFDGTIKIYRNGKPFGLITPDKMWREWSDELKMYVNKVVVDSDTLDDLIIQNNMIINSRTGELVTTFVPESSDGTIKLVSGNYFEAGKIYDEQGNDISSEYDNLTASEKDYQEWLNDETAQQELYDYDYDVSNIANAEEEYNQNPTDSNYNALDELRRDFARRSGVRMSDSNTAAFVDIIDVTREGIINHTNAVIERHGAIFYKHFRGRNASSNEMLDLNAQQYALLRIFEDGLDAMGEEDYREYLNNNSRDIFILLDDIEHYKSYSHLTGSIARLAAILNNGPLSELQWADLDSVNYIA